jgi:thiamine-monophosphate kinase
LKNVMLTEFDLIARYFKRSHIPTRAALGIGDDCALLEPAADMQWAVSTDMLVAGRHFFADADPQTIGHKALAVNLSDLAAMGAQPRAFTLALALPQAEPDWLEHFSRGLFALADRYNCELIGGDTTRGPLTIIITVFGEIAPGHALTRAAAQPADEVWVSGVLGDARLMLGVLRNEWHVPDKWLPALRRALEQPEPRVALGQALSASGVVHAAIDLSDGLAGDLMHIVQRSHCHARINADALPRSAALRAQPLTVQRECSLAGGDDYELCFTAPAAAHARSLAIGQQLGMPLTCIGTIDACALANQPRIEWHDSNSQLLSNVPAGYEHFKDHNSIR